MMTSGSAIEKLLRNVRLCIIVILLIGLSISRILNWSPEKHIPEWCFVGIGVGIIIWICADIIRLIVKIHKERSMALPFVISSEFNE